jgi:hypothetical protein
MRTLIPFLQRGRPPGTKNVFDILSNKAWLFNLSATTD